jgi:hypothetical protein
MIKKQTMSGKIRYVKPAVLDLGAIEVIYGLCDGGQGDTGDCNFGEGAGGDCPGGTNATTSHYYPDRPERRQ